VSRWMTWLPNSLKNAANCDKWYQLQNLSITESLNANGALEKLPWSKPKACRITQCRQSTTKNGKERKRGVSPFFLSLSSTTFSLVSSEGFVPLGLLKLWSLFSRHTAGKGKKGDNPKQHQKKEEEGIYFPSHLTFFSTDLRAVGLPAKLKHIIQRRKRKQP